jgi:phosphatidate phosphatase APP1
MAEIGFTYTYEPEVTVSGNTDNVTFTSTTDQTDIIIASPFFIPNDWEAIRLEKEKRQRESNTVHLQEKRKNLFRKKGESL